MDDNCRNTNSENQVSYSDKVSTVAGGLQSVSARSRTKRVQAYVIVQRHILSFSWNGDMIFPGPPEQIAQLFLEGIGLTKKDQTSYGLQSQAYMLRR